MSEPRIAVIGGTGFIGRALVARLATLDARVTVVAPTAPATPLPPNATWHGASITDERRLHAALAGVDVVYNLAGAHGLESQPRATFEALNVGAAHTLVRVLETHRIPQLVFTSTARVYGDIARPDEDAPAHPTNDYGATKLAAEQVYRAWQGGDGERRLVIVRPAVVVGVGAHATGGTFLRMIAAPDYALPGEGREHKAVAYVENLAAFLVHVRGLAAANATYNYADQPDLELREIVAIVRTAIGLAPATRRAADSWARATLRALAGRAPSAASVTPERAFDVTRAFATGFVAPVPLRDALAHTAREELGWMRLLGRRGA